MALDTALTHGVFAVDSSASALSMNSWRHLVVTLSKWYRRSSVAAMNRRVSCLHRGCCPALRSFAKRSSIARRYRSPGGDAKKASSSGGTARPRPIHTGENSKRGDSDSASDSDGGSSTGSGASGSGTNGTGDGDGGPGWRPLPLPPRPGRKPWPRPPLPFIARAPPVQRKARPYSTRYRSLVRVNLVRQRRPNQ